ncbi:MAG TPA: nuclear transport factor 2 family protein [Nitrospira sp.]|nr:nuclear transport factor 2 family protein [Nitrospira sp.]
MLDTDDPALWYAIHRVLTNYWVLADASGEEADEFYVPGGSFEVAGRRFEGHDQISGFYADRARHKIEHKTSSRHLISNLRVFQDDARHVRAVGVMTLYRGDGGPPVPVSKPPTMIHDFEAQCVLGDDNMWRFQSHVLTLIFDGRNSS